MGRPNIVEQDARLVVGVAAVYARRPPARAPEHRLVDPGIARDKHYRRHLGGSRRNAQISATSASRPTSPDPSSTPELGLTHPRTSENPLPALERTRHRPWNLTDSGDSRPPGRR
jgi:hypothetical protein